jgi:hypothetical protein
LLPEVANVAIMTRPRLKEVKPLDGYRLRLVFVNGVVYTVDCSLFIKESRQLAPLQDRALFGTATVIPGEGWAVEWPCCDIQIGADTLWLDALAQNAPDESTRFFAGWRSKYGLSLKQAADALGLTTRTISAYSTGARPIPKAVQLACIGWESLQQR